MAFVPGLSKKQVEKVIENYADLAPATMQLIDDLSAQINDPNDPAAALISRMTVAESDIDASQAAISNLNSQVSGKQDIVSGISSSEIQTLDGIQSNIQSQLDSKAPTSSPTLSNPTLTGTVTLPNSSIANDKLANSSISINGTTVPLGGQVTVTGTALPSQTNNAGKALVTDGSSLAWQTVDVSTLNSPTINSPTINTPGLTYAGSSFSVIDAYNIAFYNFNNLVPSIGETVKFSNYNDSNDYFTAVINNVTYPYGGTFIFQLTINSQGGTLAGFDGSKNYSVSGLPVSISPTEISYLDGLTGNIQSQIQSLTSPMQTLVNPTITADYYAGPVFSNTSNDGVMVAYGGNFVATNYGWFLDLNSNQSFTSAEVGKTLVFNTSNPAFTVKEFEILSIAEYSGGIIAYQFEWPSDWNVNFAFGGGGSSFPADFSWNVYDSVGQATITPTEIAYLDGLTGNIQNQLQNLNNPTITASTPGEVLVEGTFSNNMGQVDLIGNGSTTATVYLVGSALAEQPVFDVLMNTVANDLGNNTYQISINNNAITGNITSIVSGYGSELTLTAEFPTAITGTTTYGTTAKVTRVGADKIVSATEISYLDGLTGNVQSQLSFDSATINSSTSSGNLEVYLKDGGVAYYDLTSESSSNGLSVYTFFSSTSPSLNDAMAIGKAATFVIMIKNGVNPQYISSIMSGIDPLGNIIWQGGTAPTSGNANATDVYTITALKTAANTFEVFADVAKFA